MTFCNQLANRLSYFRFICCCFLRTAFLLLLLSLFASPTRPRHRERLALPPPSSFTRPSGVGSHACQTQITYSVTVATLFACLCLSRCVFRWISVILVNRPLVSSFEANHCTLLVSGRVCLPWARLICRHIVSLAQGYLVLGCHLAAASPFPTVFIVYSRGEERQFITLCKCLPATRHKVTENFTLLCLPEQNVSFTCPTGQFNETCVTVNSGPV